MKLITAILAAATLISTPAMSADLFQKNACIGCHDAEKKKMGPSWKNIAAKSSKEEIKNAIANGSKGKFGKIPMPPQPKAVADADALADAILAHK
jgi:cytochrome c